MKNKKRSENSLTQSFQKNHKLDLESSVPTARFLNGCFDKNRIKLLVTWSLKNCGQKMTIDLIEDLKTLGFSYATKAGISLGIDDLTIPLTKNKLLLSADKNIKKTQINYNQEFLTGIEKFQHLIDTWHRTSETLKQNVISHFKVTNILNPVYMMAFSGARGNVSQVRQLVGMRGLMADPQGQILDFPIKSNFREGITLTEYIISCYGARKGLVDTALKTANSGYLTRRLVDVSHHIIVFDFDCKTHRGVILTNLLENKKVIVPLQARLIGRILAENIYSDIDIQTKKTNINSISIHSKSTKILNYFRKKKSVNKLQNEVNNILIQRKNQNFADETLILHQISINSSKYFLFFYLLLLNNKKIINTNSELNLFEKLQSIILQKTQKLNQTLARRGRKNLQFFQPKVPSNSRCEDFANQNQYQLNFNFQNLNNLNVLFFKIFLKFLSDACFYHTKHKLIALKNQEISAPLSLQISALKKTVLVRSPLTCEIKNSICQLCYGWGLAYGKLVPLGEAVGVIAAQSIGEPGTQLTMRTFHTGGVFSGDIMSEILAPFDGKIIFSSFLHGTLIRTSHGKIAFLTKIAGQFKIEKILKSVEKTSLSKQKNNQLQIQPKKNKNDSKLASLESSSSSVILDQNKKKSEFFEIPSLTILFVRNLEFINKNKLIAEFSFMLTDANQRIQATSDLNAEIDGEIFFKKMLLKISKKNNQLISKTTCDLGSIWILSGKICKQPNSINLFAQPGDLVDTNSMIGEYQIVSSNTGFVEINKNLLHKQKKPLVNQIWLNYPLFCSLIRNVQYKKFAYFLKLFYFKKTKFLLTNLQIKDQYFFIGNSLNQIFLNSNNFAKKFVFKSLNKNYETKTGGKIILDKFYFNEKIYFGFIFWINQQNIVVNNQFDFSCFSQKFQEKSICTDLAITNLFLFFKVFKNISEYTLKKQKLVYLTRLKKKNKIFHCNQSFVGEAGFSLKPFLQTKQNFKHFSTSTQIKLNQQKKSSPLASRAASYEQLRSNRFNLLVGKDKLQNRKIITSLNFSNKNESVIFYYNSQGKFFNVYSKISGYIQFFYLSTFFSNPTQYFLWSQKNFPIFSEALKIGKAALPILKTVKKVNSFFLPKLIKKKITKTHFNYRFHQTSLKLNPGLGLSFLFFHNLKKKKKMKNQKVYIYFINHLKIQSTLLKNRNLEFKLKKQFNSRTWKKNFQSLKKKLINNTLTTDKMVQILDFYISCFYSRNVAYKSNKQKFSNIHFYQFHLTNLYKNSKNVFLKNFFYSVKKHKTIKLPLLTKKKIIMVSPQFPWKHFKKNNNKIKRKFKFYFLANKIREKTLVLNLALCNTSFLLNKNYTTDKFCLEREILISKKTNLKKQIYNQNSSILSQQIFFYYPKTLTASSYSLQAKQTEKYKPFSNKKTLNIQIFLKPGTLSLFLYELNQKYNRKKFTSKKNKTLQNHKIQQSTFITKYNKQNILSISSISSPILIPSLNKKTLKKIKIKPGWVYISKNNTKNFINHNNIISPGKLSIQPILFDQYSISFEYIVINQVLVKKNRDFSKKKNDLNNQIQFKKITTKLKKQIVNDSTLKYSQKNSNLIKIVPPGFAKNKNQLKNLVLKKNRKQNQKLDKKNFQPRFGNFQSSTENFFNKKILKFCFLLKNGRSLFFYNTKVVSAIKNTKKIKNNKLYLIYEIFLIKKNLYSSFLTQIYSQSRQSISKKFFPEKSLFIVEQIHKAAAIAQSQQKKNVFSGKNLLENHLTKRFLKFNKNQTVYPVSKINFAELKISIFKAIHLKKKKYFIQQKNHFSKTLLKQTLYKIYFLKNENFNTVKNFLTINKNKTEKKLTQKLVKIFFINQPLILKKNLVINQNCAEILHFCINEHFFSETKIKLFLVEQKKQVFKDSTSNLPLFKLKNFNRNLENFNSFLVQKNILSNSNKKKMARRGKKNLQFFQPEVPSSSKKSSIFKCEDLQCNFLNLNRTRILSLKTNNLSENLFVVIQKISEFSFFNLKKYKKIISKQNTCFCISNTKKFTNGLFEKKIQKISNIYRFQNSQNYTKKFKLIKKITTNLNFLLPDQKLFFNPFILTQLSIKQTYSESLKKSFNKFKNIKLRTSQFQKKVKISKSSVKQVLAKRAASRVNFIHFQSNNKQYNIELFLPVPSTDFHIKYCFKHTFSKKILFLKNINLLEHFIYFNIPNQYKYNYIKILLCSASNIKKYLNIVICLKYKLSSQPLLNTKQFKNLNRSVTEPKFLFSQKNYVLPQTPIENTSLLSFFCGEILKSGLYRKNSFNVKTDINKNKVRDKENLTFVLNPHKSQNYLILTYQDKIKFKVNPAKIVKKQNNTDLFFLGKNIRYGSKINKNLALPTSGILIQIEKSKIILRKTQSILFSPKGLVAVYPQDIIEKNTLVLSLFYQRLKSGDIVQGIPRIEQLFEARKTNQGESLSYSLHEHLEDIFLYYIKKYNFIQAARYSLEKIQQIIVNNVQKVYKSQAVTIADKHLEIIIRQMTSKVQIIRSGQTSLLPGEIVDLDWIELINKNIEKKKAKYVPIILGITRKSLETKSFLSEASFQETTRVLSRSAIKRKTDFLKGLKENVILGHLVPAGTGFHANTGLYKKIFNSIILKYYENENYESYIIFRKIFLKNIIV